MIDQSDQFSDAYDLLIIGAGPFGLAMAAHAQTLGVKYAVIGKPMSFWREHMPAGMLLRSGSEWHLDCDGQHTIERFRQVRGRARSDLEPLSLKRYLEYAEWFQEMRGIEAHPTHVCQLIKEAGRFVATLDDNTVLTAHRVLLALGFASFAHVPDDLAALVPSEFSSHTCDCSSPAEHAGQRVLIVGGRQSAFETAALLAESGTSSVHLCHRHESPKFVKSDWSWVDPLLERISEEPGWYRRLPESERKALDARFWEEGRLKLEPWLGPRVHRDEIKIHAETRLVDCRLRNEELQVRLDNGESIHVDHVMFATGYKVDLQRVPLLADSPLLSRIECRDGSPVLDDSMQTTVPGLHMTSLPAAQDFGLFFAFTAAVRASAHIVGRALLPS